MLSKNTILLQTSADDNAMIFDNEIASCFNAESNLAFL